MSQHPETDATPGPAAHCPVCGTVLPTNAPRGLCARCLLEGAAAPTEAATPGPGAGHRHPPPALERIAAAFPQLEILGLIGVGGMGAVFKARQRHLDRLVALKVLPESLAAHPSFAERFNREARVLARLNHPNIVTVHDFGQADGWFFLLMEYVDGVNLRQAMHVGRFTPSQALSLVPRICEALQFAHDEGILHRDIKPENILLDTRGRLKIADFGIAKLLGENSPTNVTLTASGAALGTPAYMAPEQIEKPAEVDHRADIYSLGVVLYEMLTGELPLGRFAPPSEKTPEPVDRRVDDLVFRALEKEREKRFQSANEVRTRVETLGQTPTVASEKAAAANPNAEATLASGPSSARADFIVCHPALPRMAKAMTIYGLFVVPALMFLTLGTLTLPQHSNPYARFIESMVLMIALGGDVLASALIFAGAWMLRGLRRSAGTVFALGVWIHLATGFLVLLGALWQESISPSPVPTAHMPTSDLVHGMIGIGAAVFEIAALVWLYRHRDVLEAAMARGRTPARLREPAPAVFGPPPTPVRHATLAAVLTCLSLGLGLPAASGLAIGVISLFRPQPVLGGFGSVEVLLILVLGAVIVGLGFAGLLLGLRALHEVQAAGRTGYGTRRAVFGACGWPLVLTATAAMFGAGAVFIRIFDTALMTAVGSLVIAVGCAELLLSGAWRWLRQPASGSRMERRPAWTHGLAVVSVAATALALFPPLALSHGLVLRANLPPPIVAIEGDPGFAPGTPSDRSTLQLSVHCPPRSLVRMRTTLLRDGQALRSPLDESHLVNLSLQSSDHPLLIRVLPTEDVNANGPRTIPNEWETVARTAAHTYTYAYHGEETREVRWAPVGRSQLETFPVGSGTQFPILRGEGPNGSIWSVHLRLESEPLSPLIHVDDRTLLGSGPDWSATVKETGTNASTK